MKELEIFEEKLNEKIEQDEQAQKLLSEIQESFDKILKDQLEKAQNKKEKAALVYGFAVTVLEFSPRSFMHNYYKNIAQEYFSWAADQDDNYIVKNQSVFALGSFFGQRERARKYFEKIIKQDCDQVIKAEAFYYGSFFTDDEQEKEKYLQNAARHSDSKELQSSAFYYLAELKVKQKEFTAAEELFLKVIQQSNKDCLVINSSFSLGKILFEKNEWDKAQEFFYRAYNQNDYKKIKANAAYYLGMLFLEKDEEKAEGYLKDAIHLDGDEELKEQAILRLGALLEQQKRTSEAREYLQKSRLWIFEKNGLLKPEAAENICTGLADYYEKNDK